jgi:hypothetical protein
MTNRRTLAEDEIGLLLEHEDDNDDHSVSSISDVDHLSEDDVQSDVEDEYIEEESIDASNENVLQPGSPEPSGSSERDQRIIVPSSRVIRGKNRYCWSTTKDRTHGRTSAINIVRTARGPTRLCRNIDDPVLCFNLFITDEIIEEIVQWTNIEISSKRSASMTKATFRDTCTTEV